MADHHVMLILMLKGTRKNLKGWQIGRDGPKARGPRCAPPSRSGITQARKNGKCFLREILYLSSHNAQVGGITGSLVFAASAKEAFVFSYPSFFFLAFADSPFHFVSLLFFYILFTFFTTSNEMLAQKSSMVIHSKGVCSIDRLFTFNKTKKH